VVNAIPALISGGVALAKVNELALADYQASFGERRIERFGGFQTIVLDAIRYRYPSVSGETGFLVGPVDLTLQRGEIVFLIGGNGSGKSSVARLLTGLYRPHDGVIRVDGVPVGDVGTIEFRRLFSSVFSDFHLFSRLVGESGQRPPSIEVARWVGLLAMREKAVIKGDVLADLRLSQGQRKRLALLSALLEQRPVLVLDEWAADQDPAFRHHFYTQLIPALKAEGRTILAITHDERYFDTADRILKVDGGRLVEIPRGVGAFDLPQAAAG
jgi:putative ATP-binding cassette transporter